MLLAVLGCQRTRLRRSGAFPDQVQEFLAQSPRSQKIDDRKLADHEADDRDE
jgi:hypothetical protein